MQTIWPRLFHRSDAASFDRERVALDDGDFIDLDWFEGVGNENKLVVLIHGLSGSSSSHYIKRVGEYLSEQDYGVVVYNLRGATGPNRLPRAYHSGDTMDLQFILDYLNARMPSYRLFAVGFSLGGNILLKWLAENPQQNLLNKSVAVSVPFDLSTVAHQLNKGRSKIYKWILLSGLRKFLRSKEEILKDKIDLEAAYAAKTFHEYDGIVTAPLSGFKDVHDYYSQSSSGQYLKNIRSETLIIHAKDDPFTTAEIIPKSHQVSDRVTLAISDYGGHVGFVSRGKFNKVEYWLPKRIVRFLGDGS